MAGKDSIEMADGVTYKASCNIGSVFFSGWKGDSAQLIWRPPEEIKSLDCYVNFRKRTIHGGPTKVSIIAACLNNLIREETKRDDIEVIFQISE